MGKPDRLGGLQEGVALESEGAGLRSYWILLLLMALVLMLLFVVVEVLGIPLLTQPGLWLADGGVVAGFVGVGLLIADVLLPVPSSLVMIALGTLFGPLWGTLLSLIGSAGAGGLGFALGRWCSPLLVRFLPQAERIRADDLLARWGELAVLVTRPVPIVAESVAMLAGTSPMRWPRFLLATLIGSLPASLLYALAGATAAKLDNAALVFGIVLAIAGLFWLVGRRVQSSAFHGAEALREAAQNDRGRPSRTYEV